MRYLYLALVIWFSAAVIVSAQDVQTANFRSVVEKRLKDSKGAELKTVCPIDSDTVAERIFRDYGAIFVSSPDAVLPSRCIFETEEEVRSFQSSVEADRANIGGAQVTLQKAAMVALLAARLEAAKSGLQISPRGGSEASTRSYSRTAGLWKSRFIPGLNHWTGKGKITRSEAANALRATTREQIEMVLAWEEKGLFFSTDMTKSILYSVAAPGASQHIFMLAIDIQQFANSQVRQILARHGWFQTVKSDLPHFTYLGVSESQLPSLGLKSVPVSGQIFWIPNF